MFVGNPFKLTGLKNPTEKHLLVIEDISKGLEPIYFWMLDYINEEYTDSVKLVDNFVTSVNSQQFSESGQKATRMQEEAMNLMQTSGVLIKSILNLIYDLREFKIRLSTYDDLKSKEDTKKNSAFLVLKQMWMHQVDTAKRGTGSINALAQQLDFVILRDAFMAASSLEEVDNMDLNDRVKRILRQRVWEFELWVKESEKELRKRYEIEKIYLKNQLNSARLYARWVKPYLRASKDLEQRAQRNSSLVNAFNTTLLELSVLGKKKYNIKEGISMNSIPKHFFKTIKKNYNFIAIIEFRFRSIPERNNQGGYAFRGRAEIEFTSYVMTDKELEIFLKEVEKDDVGDLMRFAEGMTDDSLAKIQFDLDEFLEDEKKMSDKKKEIEDKKKEGDVNPFSALLSIFKSDKKENKDEG